MSAESIISEINYYENKINTLDYQRAQVESQLDLSNRTRERAEKSKVEYETMRDQIQQLNQLVSTALGEISTAINNVGNWSKGNNGTRISGNLSTKANGLTSAGNKLGCAYNAAQSKIRKLQEEINREIETEDRLVRQINDIVNDINACVRAIDSLNMELFEINMGYDY